MPGNVQKRVKAVRAVSLLWLPAREVPKRKEARVRLQAALEKGVPIKGQRTMRCPKGHLKQGENLDVTPLGYKQCRICERERKRESIRRIRAASGKLRIRPYRLSDVVPIEVLREARDCGLSLRETGKKYGIPASCVHRMRKERQ